MHTRESNRNSCSAPLLRIDLNGTLIGTHSFANPTNSNSASAVSNFGQILSPDTLAEVTHFNYERGTINSDVYISCLAL